MSLSYNVDSFAELIEETGVFKDIEIPPGENCNEIAKRALRLGQPPDDIWCMWLVFFSSVALNTLQKNI
jgi:hypothetical protein